MVRSAGDGSGAMGGHLNLRIADAGVSDDLVERGTTRRPTSSQEGRLTLHRGTVPRSTNPFSWHSGRLNPRSEHGSTGRSDPSAQAKMPSISATRSAAPKTTMPMTPTTPKIRTQRRPPPARRKRMGR